MSNILAAFFSGFAGSLGLGGGGVLVLYLVLSLGEEQITAQGINLLFFIPCAALSTVVYSFKKLIDWKTVLAAAAGGLPGVLLGSWLLRSMDPLWPGKIFGAFLLIMGLKELFAKQKKIKKDR
ncbi:MAG: sulfite exporter TauE/SafE family protein [Clostridia bacterium]|nr:sulfite exporter TauE/SafE family protein [Oscillospiraceae bacterium]MDD6220344.1 sulfite exporter TauE/SafE family protein [Clostridia bacterium]